MRRISLLLGLLLATSGCSKRASSALSSHAEDFARLDKLIAQGQAEVAKIPERGVKQVGRCKPDPKWAWGSLGTGLHNIDVVPGSAMGFSNALGDSLELRRRNEGKSYFSSDKITSIETGKLDQLKDIKHLIFVRDHKTTDKFHLTADVFVFNGETGKITCGFGFDGGQAEYGSTGTVVGKEIVTNKKTGKVVAERDWVEGKSEGTTGAYEARNKISPHFARVLGFAVYSGPEDEKAAKEARDGTAPKGMGKYPRLQVERVLEERAANVIGHSRVNGAGDESTWRGDGFQVFLVDASSDANVAVGAEQSVAIEGLPDRAAVAASLVGKPWKGQAELIARLRGAGIQVSSPPVDVPPREGVVRYTLMGKKEQMSPKIMVVDYSAAAQRQSSATVRIDGRRVVIVHSTLAALGTAEEIATEIATSKL